MSMLKGQFSNCTRASEIDLWVAPIVESERINQVNYYDSFSNREKRRYLRLRRDGDRYRFLVSRILLRKVLSLATGGRIDPFSWRLTEDSQGKPEVDKGMGLPSLKFNLSHSHQLTAIAVSHTYPVGIDIERCVRTVDANLYDIVLSPEEQAWLSTRPFNTRHADFTTLWTLKEAYAKLTGLGLFLDFKSFQVMYNPTRIKLAGNGQSRSDRLYLKTLEIRIYDCSYHLSLAAWMPWEDNPYVKLHLLDSPFMESLFNGSICDEHTCNQDVCDRHQLSVSLI